jgi:preprotein translocase SecE subunit
MNPIGFLQEAYQELLKSTWLPRPQAVSSTIVVVILVTLIAVYAGAIDAVLSFLMRSLLGSY